LHKLVAGSVCLVTFALMSCAHSGSTETGTASAGATASPSGKSLYDRLGGMDAIKAVVDDFINSTAADPKVNKFFAHTDAAHLKGQISEMLCQATGGPCKYTGMSMKDAHAGRKIASGDFDVVAGHLVDTLNKLKVPEQEQKDLLAIVAPLKSDIVAQQ